MTISSALVCDGCGRAATSAHIAERSQRLEWATRFRPLHIQILFVADAPIGSLAEDFYALPCAAGSAFDALLDAACVSPALANAHPAEQRGTEQAATGRAAQLAEFQRAGMYLAFRSECPPESAEPIPPRGNGEGFVPGSVSEPASLGSRLDTTLVKRIQRSYRPKHIALLSTATRDLTSVLKQAGFGDAPALDGGAPIVLPPRGDAAGTNHLRGILRRFQSGA